MSETNGNYSLLDSNSEDIRSGKLRTPKVVPVVKKSVSEKKKKRRIYFLCVIAVSILAACMIIPRMIYSINEALTYDIVINETDISNFNDGSYRGACEVGQMSAVVTVTIISGKMTGISLDSYTGISASRAQEIFTRVIYYQMLNIPEADSADIFSETTDFVVLKAIESALASGSYSMGVNV